MCFGGMLKDGYFLCFVSAEGLWVDAGPAYHGNLIKRAQALLTFVPPTILFPDPRMHFSKTYTQLLAALPQELRENAIPYHQVSDFILLLFPNFKLLFIS